MENSLAIFDVNAVITHDGHTATSSLKIAEIFKKRHKNVLRDIESLDCSSDFNGLNFQPVEYKDAKGEMRKSYFMTKDGFMFLAMGFTGKKASQIKESFIRRFNELEAGLNKRLHRDEIKQYLLEEKEERARIRKISQQQQKANTRRSTLKAYNAVLGAKVIVTVRDMARCLFIGEQSVRKRITGHPGLNYKNGIVYETLSKSEMLTVSNSDIRKRIEVNKIEFPLPPIYPAELKQIMQETVREEIRKVFKEMFNGGK